MQDLFDLMSYCKQVQWTDGIILILESRSLHEAFHRLSLDKQFTFCRDVMMLPYMQVPEEEDDEQSNVAELVRPGELTIE